MGSAEWENETTAPADWANWTPFTLVAPWETGLSEIGECLLNETQSLLVIYHRCRSISALAAIHLIPTATEIHEVASAA